MHIQVERKLPLSSHIIDNMMSDSKNNNHLFKNTLKLLSTDQIIDITWMRVHDNNTLRFATTLPPTHVEAYINKGIYQLDDFVILNSPISFEVLDYEKLPIQITIPKFLQTRICIVITKNHLTHTDRFSFDIDKTYFSQLIEADKMQLHQRLTHATSLLSTQITLKTVIEPIPHFSPKFKESTSSNILKLYDLSPILIEYLRYIAMGMTSKEIAQKVHKSHRTIEDAIKALRHKVNASSKSELMLIANIITSYK